MYFYIITSFITAFASILLGFIVFIKNPRSSINKLFGFYTLAVFLWSFFYSIWLFQNEYNSALFWSRALNAGAALIPIAYLHWVLVFLKKDKAQKTLLIIGYLITATYLLFSFSNIYIKEVKQVFFFPYWPQGGWLYFLYLIINYFGMVFYGSYLLYREIEKTSGFYKEQIRYAFIGSVIAFLGGATNFPLLLGFEILPPIGNPLVNAFPLLFAYAIVRHRLMDIKLVLRRSSVYIFSLATIAILSIIVQFALSSVFSGYDIVVNLLALLFAVSIFPKIKDIYYHVANQYFFSSLYDSRRVIAETSEKLRSTLDAVRIFAFITNTLSGIFHSKWIGILAYDQNAKEYKVQSHEGIAIDDKITKAVKEINEAYLTYNIPILVEELREGNYLKKQTINLLLGANVEIIAPLNVKDKAIGLILLGPKESMDMYNSEDIQVLEIISAQAAIAIENALLYKETKDFSVKLEEEVKRATDELRMANEELRKLDQTKSEFISIASHQLRTPLTIIKGYISMLLEENFGRIGDGQRAPLFKVYESNERLIRLVENLLNISRIESGRIQYRFEAIDFTALAESTFKELSGFAAKKGIKAEIIKPAVPLPPVIADPDKIKEVVSNLIDNSVKYTKKGTITVSTERRGGRARFCVADTGMGIKPEDLPRLFKKFNRGTGSPLVHTEGTGLGLYVAKMMIKAHNGTIWAKSAGERRGSRFCFEIPIDPSSPEG